MNNYWIEKAVKTNQKLLKMKALTLTFLKTKENLIMMMLLFQESRKFFKYEKTPDQQSRNFAWTKKGGSSGMDQQEAITGK